MRRSVRIAIGFLSLVALVGLCVHYGAAYDENWPHPTGEQLGEEYDAYVGDRVLLFGDVQSVDAADETLVIHATDSGDTVVAELEVRGFDADETVEAGGVVQVYGVLGADRTMHADDVVIVDRSPSATQYKLGVSVVGIGLALGFFLSRWRLNLRTLGFEPRSFRESSSGDEEMEGRDG